MGRGRLSSVTLAPYVLVRVAALPLDTLDRLQCRRALKAARELDTVGEALDETRDSLCERLFEAANGCTDVPLRRALLETKRAVFNGRPPRETKTIETVVGALADDSVLREDLLEWESAARRQTRSLCEGETALRDDMAEVEARLKGLWSNDTVQRGILFAQPHLFDRLEASAGVTGTPLPRKLLDALSAYCYRTVTKTSPFGAFTATAVCRADGVYRRLDADGSPRERSTFTLNARIVEELDGVLREHPNIRRELPLYLNETAEPVGVDIAFLAPEPHDSGGVSVAGRRERLVSVKRDPLVDLVVRLVTQMADGQTLSDLQERVAGSAPSRDVRDRIVASLDQLATIGLLIPSLDYEANQPNALGQLAQSQPLGATPAGAAVQARLREGHASLDALEGEPAPVQRRLLADLRSALQGAFAAAGHTPAALRTQGLVHHDAYLEIDGTDGADMEGVRGVLPGLSRINSALPLFNTQIPYRHLVQRHARERIDRRQAGESVVSLYRRFCEDGMHEASAATADLEQCRRLMADRLRAEAAADLSESVGEVDLPRSLLEQFSETAARYRVRGARLSTAYLGQLSRDAEGVPRFVINHALPGYGQVAGHCTAEGDGSATRAWLVDALQAHRRSLAAGAIVADMVGTFGFNGQIRAPLSPFRLAYPGEAVRRNGTRPTPWSEVHPTFDPEQDAVRLLHAPTGRWVLPLLTGTLGVGLMPPFFRYVASFGPAFEPELPLVDLFEEWPGADARQRVRRYRRLTHAGVVMVRETWCVPRDAIPVAEGRRHTLFADFRRLRCWARDHGLPQRVFVTIARSGQLATGEGDPAQFRRLHKPFYVDWDDPLSQRMFHRLMRAAPRTITITEMLPGLEELKGSGPHRRRVTEHLVELADE